MRVKILSASAGSGKTYRLAYKFVHDTIKHLYTKPYLYRAILAVTFTNKATEEMKRRILSEINTLAVEPAKSSYIADLQRELAISQDEIAKRAKIIRTKILHDYSRFTILTIDKFFQRILRAFVKELGMELNYNIELDTDTILAQSTDSLIEDISEDKDLYRWIMAFAQERIDNDRAWDDIRKDMNKLGKALFNESSKHAIQKSIPREELEKIMRQADKKAAIARAELKALGEKAMGVMHEAGVEPSDFAGKSNSFANIFAKVAAEKEFNITATTLSRAQSPEKWSTNPAAQAIAPKLCDLLNDIIEQHNSSRRLLATLDSVKQNYRSYALLQDINRKVCEQCDQEGIMLLPETKYILSKFVEDNDAPFIYEKSGNRFERFMIDEFQDTSLKEWGNFVPLLKNAISQSDETSVLIVGDVKQSIYRWRGGDWRILMNGVSDSLGVENTHTENMEQNYRSLKQVVEFNNSVMEAVVKAENQTLNSELDSALSEGKITAQTHGQLLNTLQKAYTKHEQEPRVKSQKSGYVYVEPFEQTPPIVECIESAIARGYSYSDIMILHRSEKDGLKAAKILMEYKRQNNSFNIMTQDSLVIGTAAVSNFVIAVMRLSQNRRDSISLAIMNDYLGRDYDCALSNEELMMLSSISQLTPEQAFEQIVMRYSLDKHEDEIAYLQALHEQVVSFCASKLADIQLFLKMWDEKGSAKSLSVENGDSTIELMTIHKAKGLEKKIVIIPYCSWGLDPRPGNTIWATPKQGEELSEIGQFPINYKKEMAQTIYADEYIREKVYSHVDAVNLLYVALTRAKEELYAFIPTKKRPGGAETGQLLWSAVKDKAVTDEENSRTWVEYGQKLAPEPDKGEKSDKGVKNVLIRNYPTTRVEMVHPPFERYFEESSKATLAPRNVGITMHEILNQADDADDVIAGIETACTDGRLTAKQAEDLKAVIEREFSRSEVSEWFGQWDDVRRENDILCTHTVGTRRPDRVMIKGERAVVVDYKFGEDKLPAHRKQINEYMQLLQQMGYTQVEGYVWYLTLGEIVRIS